MEKEKKKLPIRMTVQNVADIMNVSQRTAQEVLKEIKKKNKKPLKNLVTLTEFCLHTGFTLEEIHIHYNGYENN